MNTTLRTERLRVIMAVHKLSVLEVGAILERSPQTVRSWRSTKYTKRVIPALALKALESAVK